jgi:hypothetical protein
MKKNVQSNSASNRTTDTISQQPTPSAGGSPYNSKWSLASLVFDTQAEQYTLLADNCSKPMAMLNAR